MSNEELHYIYESEEFNKEPSKEFYSAPVRMGREREHFLRRSRIVNEFIEQQVNSDLAREYKKEVDTSVQVFGISSQNKNKRVSLDEKFPGDIPYRIETDNMAPFIFPKTVVLLKFADQHLSGEVCIYRYHGNTYCNQIDIVNDKIIAKSTNPKYKDVVLDRDEYIFIATVASGHFHMKEVMRAYR